MSYRKVNEMILCEWAPGNANITWRVRSSIFVEPLWVKGQSVIDCSSLDNEMSCWERESTGNDPPCPRLLCDTTRSQMENQLESIVGLLRLDASLS